MQSLQQQLDALYEREAQLAAQSAQLAAQSARLTAQMLEVQREKNRLLALQAERAAWRARQQGRQQLRAEHATGGGSGGSSGVARNGSGGSGGTDDLQRDLYAGLDEELAQQLGVSAGEQQEESPADGAAAEEGSARATPPGGMDEQQEESPADGAAAEEGSARATPPGGMDEQQEESPADGAAAEEGSARATPPGGMDEQQEEAPADGAAAVEGSAHAPPPGGEALGATDDDASPDSMLPAFGLYGVATPLYRPGQERPGELAVWAGPAGPLPGNKAPRASLTHLAVSGRCGAFGWSSLCSAAWPPCRFIWMLRKAHDAASPQTLPPLLQRVMTQPGGLAEHHWWQQASNQPVGASSLQAPPASLALILSAVWCFACCSSAALICSAFRSSHAAQLNAPSSVHPLPSAGRRYQ